MIEYNKDENIYTENGGAKITPHEVLIRLRTLEMLQGQIREGHLLPIHIVTNRFTQKQMDGEYDKGFKDAMIKYRKD